MRLREGTGVVVEGLFSCVLMILKMRFNGLLIAQKASCAWHIPAGVNHITAKTGKKSK